MLAAALLLAASAAVPGCGDERQGTAETRLLVLDGICITLDDVAPYLAFLDACLPEGGHKTKVQKILDDQLIPLRLGQRAFAAERQRLRERADALRAVSSNVEELEQHTALLETKGRLKIGRMQAKLPAAMFLFDALQLRSVSQPLELPQGWMVVAAYDLHESAMAVHDWVDALEITFYTHTTGEWLGWYAVQKAALASTATFVHPDYRNAMPEWIQLPKLP